MKKIRIGILGYGNLARGVEKAICQSNDLELVKVFSRRSNIKTVSGIMCTSSEDLHKYKDEIDVLILAGGSATDLPIQTPNAAKYFNVVDSYDTHAKVPQHFSNVDKMAKESKKLAVISAGWDPGLFSMARIMFSSFLPDGQSYVFWGDGVSQGHSDAIRRVEGVKYAIQYTIPIKQAIDDVRGLKTPKYTARQMHKRDCYVVLHDNADAEKVKNEIINMPNYFANYDTSVYFISEKEFNSEHCGMPHGGLVLRSGKTHDKNQLLELSIKLEDNPLFTGSILASCARACYLLNKQGKNGAITMLDIPLKYFSTMQYNEILSEII